MVVVMRRRRSGFGPYCISWSYAAFVSVVYLLKAYRRRSRGLIIQDLVGIKCPFTDELGSRGLQRSVIGSYIITLWYC